MPNPLLIDVLVNRSGRDAIFTYSVPRELADDLENGQVVRVPVKDRLATGVVWAKPAVSRRRAHVTYKPISKIVHSELKLLPYQRELANWMADQFVASLSSCVFCFLPITLKPPKDTSQDTPAPSPIHTSYLIPHTSKLRLTTEQMKALEIIKSSKKPTLLHGVTGSGKTEVYLQYAQTLMALHKQVVILVPEIALTPQTKKRFLERFGDIVDVWHSQLSASERRAIYWRVRRGNARLIVGSRSALFLPYHRLGLIVIDEEHEKSYYQESAPRYHARVVAEKLAELTGADLLMGSATPSLESVWKASSRHYGLATLNNRVKDQPMPKSIIVDLRNEPLHVGANISHILLEQLASTLEERRQAVLMLNRRGHATSALCTSCGTILLCRNCNIPYTVHHTEKGQAFLETTLQCHHCDHRETAPSRCPLCHNETLVIRGFGTEKVETELQKLLPTARILRMDRDTTSDRHIIDTMYHDFAAHRYDILLGTQMIAKGWDVPRVDLVGVLLAEGGLMLPDYHAAESTFNLLVQVSGRSGRGSLAGVTIIQTYQPDHPLIRLAAKHDFGAFAKLELKNRRQFHYPPFSVIVRLLYQHHDRARTLAETTKLARQFDHFATNAVALLGPCPCYFERLRGKYRAHLILKVMDQQALDEIKQLARTLRSPWVVEINPAQLL